MKHIKTIVIAGAGTMGASMAETFAKFKFNVIIYDIKEKALKSAKHLISINQLTEVSEKIVTRDESESLLARITYTCDDTCFAEADFIVEAIVENMDIKKKFWANVSSKAKDGVLLASNTSGLSITEISTAIRRPEYFVGMHWINPPHIIPLVEVVKGERTIDETAEEIYSICKYINKKPVIVKDAPGFVLNRIQLAILRECLYIAERGIASPEDIDKVMKYALGVRYACLGPFEVCDHGGLDIFNNIAEYLFKDLANQRESFGLLKEAVNKGNLGVKSCAGFYDYSNGHDKEALIYRDQMYTKVARCLFSE